MLNPSLDRADLAARYPRRQRIQIRDVLVPEAAERILKCLMHETPWTLTYNEGKSVVRVPPEAMQSLPPQERAARANAVLARARTEFQYVYNSYQMMEAYREGRDPGFFLHTIYEWLNSEEMISFIRDVTGVREIVKADAQATLYAPGHFLKSHNDQPEEHQHWRVAYVMGFARNWDPDWGGILQFFTPEREMVDVFLPRFNTLSLFTVPQKHAVSYVAPFAPLGRYSITGWFSDA